MLPEKSRAVLSSVKQGTEMATWLRVRSRPIRPLFPKGFKNDVHVVATVLSVDRTTP